MIQDSEDPGFLNPGPEEIIHVFYKNCPALAVIDGEFFFQDPGLPGIFLRPPSKGPADVAVAAFVLAFPPKMSMDKINPGVHISVALF